MIRLPKRVLTYSRSLPRGVCAGLMAGLGMLGIAAVTQAQPVGFPFDPATQRRVNEELITVCGDYRCDEFRFKVRVPIEIGDDLEDIRTRLNQAMLAEVDQRFGSQTNLERVIVDGYIYRGSGKLVATEVPVMTLFVPRHRWRVRRFSIEQDAIVYNELLTRLAELIPPPPPPPDPAAQPLPLELPPLPAPEAPPSPEAAPTPPPSL